MKYSQKMGGMAALVEAAAYVLGMVFFLFVVDYPGAVQPAQKVALLVGNQVSMQIVTLLTYVGFGALLVVLALALHDRLQAGSPAIMQTATAFGLIWAGLLIASVLAASVGIIGWRRRRATYRFPELFVEPRLGGQHAAGLGAVIAFASADLPPASQRRQVAGYLRRT